MRTLYADPARAERLACAALELAEELKDPASRALARRAMGHVSYGGARYQQAVAYYREALALFDLLGEEREAGRTLSSGLQSLIYLGQYEEAYRWAARAEEIFRRQGDELRLARLASNFGNILYRQDRYPEALEKYREARATLERLGEHRDVAAVLSNVAVCQISLGQFDEALDSYRVAREYCAAHELPLLVAGADYNIAYLHYLRGDFLRALELYKDSRSHCRTAGDAYHAALCDLDEAEIYLELNLNGEAAHLAEKAESGFQSLGLPYERAKAMVSHAIAASRMGEPRRARALLAGARRQFSGEANALWPALVDLYRALLLEREHCDVEAARLCRRAYRVLSGSALTGRAALAEILLSRLLLKSQDFSGARRIARRALERPEGAAPWLRLHAYVALGNVEKAAGDEHAAFGAYESARQAIEDFRSRLWGDGPKIAFLRDKLAVYENLVQAHLARSAGVEEAFRCVQQAKSRSLADLVAYGASSREPEWDHEAEQVRAALNARYRLLEHLALSARAVPTAQMDALRQSIRDYESRLLRLTVEATPNRSGAGAESLSVEAVQSAVPPDAVLLEYYIVKDVLHVCLVRRGGLEFVPLGPVGPIRTRLRLLRFQMRAFRLGQADWRVAIGGLDRAAESHLRDLHADLIAPIQHRLENAGHLIVAPHEFLHHLPFHALRGRAGFLIDQFTVSYAPSATVFALCSAKPATHEEHSLVLGLPDRLAPSIEIEAQTAAALLPAARLYLGQEASEQILRRHGPSSRFVHIATHGTFRRDNPLFSAIRLGDSHLTLLDLYNLRLSAELVALSGCGTGLSAVMGGDELVGLMRGLLLAGAQSVLVSLWDVHDLSTAQLMKHFYEHLRREGNKAAALRAAMLEIRSEHPHPYHWAPFVLAGRYQGASET